MNEHFDLTLGSSQNPKSMEISEMSIQTRTYPTNSEIQDQVEAVNWFRDHNVYSQKETVLDEEEDFPDLVVEVENKEKGKSYLTNQKPGSSYLNLISKKKKKTKAKDAKKGHLREDSELGSSKLDKLMREVNSDQGFNEDDYGDIDADEEEPSVRIEHKLVHCENIFVATETLEKDLFESEKV